MKFTFEGTRDEIREAITALVKHDDDPHDGLIPPLEISHEFVDSDSDSQVSHKLTRIGKLTVSCTCMDFIHRSHVCKHIRKANGGS